MTAQTLLRTERLLLRAPAPELVNGVDAFYRANRQHFAPWDPPTPDSFFTLAVQQERMHSGWQAFEAGQAYRYWISPCTDRNRIIGQVHVSQISRGVFQSAMLGYNLDEDAQGQGLMQEALRAVMVEVFSRRIWLHRLQANYRPENVRSAKLLANLGFAFEGEAKAYLYIDGAWRNHVMCALHNPNWSATEPPP